MRFPFLLLGPLAFVLMSSAGPAAPDATPYAWRSVNITGGGFVSGIIMHPAERGLRYVRTDVGGAYRWSAEAKRWEAITDWINGRDWTLTGIESLALDPTDPNRVYLAAGSYTNNWSGNGSILRSADRGATWERTPMPFKFGGNESGRSNGERLAVDPRAPEVLFVGTRGDGLWRSGDRGATWTRIESFTTPDDTKNIGVVGVFFNPKGPEEKVSGEPSAEVWLAVSSLSAPLWRSADAGVTWAPLSGQPLGLRPHHAKFGPNGALYVTYGNEAGPNDVTDGAVWKHTPKDGKWTDITPLKPTGGDRFGYAGLGIDSRRPGVLVVSSLCRWAKHDELFRSTDDGASWTRLGADATHDEAGVHFLKWGRPKADLGHWIGDLEIDPFDSDHALYVTGMTIWGTDNLTRADAGRGTDWTVRAQGVEETVLNEVAAPASGATLISAMWDIDGFRHEDLDTSPRAGFFQPNQGRSTGLDYAELKPDVVVRVYGKGGAFSADNGRSWTPFASVPEGTRGDGRVAVSADGAAWVWTPDGMAPHVSTDRGASWRPVEGLPREARVVSDRAAGGLFYAMTPRDGKVFASVDGGVSFRETGQTRARDGQMRAVPGRTGHLWWASGQGVFRSEDSGATWRAPGQARGERIAFGRAAAGAKYPAVFLVGDVEGVYGVYRSLDEGGTWTRIHTDKLQFNSISAIAGDPRVFGRVFLGTRGRGIFYGEPVSE